MAERAGAPIPDLSAPVAAVGLAVSIGTNQRIAGETLPPELMHLAAGPMADALAKAVSYAKRALSPRTEKIYADNWNAFEAWCQAHSAPSLPAVPAIVAAYLAHRAATVGRSGLNQIVSAIAHRHRKSGHAWSVQDPVKVLRSGDTLVVRKLDRLGRDLRHLVNLVGDDTRHRIESARERRVIDRYDNRERAARVRYFRRTSRVRTRTDCRAYQGRTDSSAR